MPARGASLDEGRLRRLLEVGRGLVAELDLDALLDQVLEVARELTGARHAAVGVLDEGRRELERFITSGIDAETHAAIGALPRGRGVLGVLITDPQPLRLHEVGAHPKSYGFPPGHPPMHGFLGVPIRVRGEAWGNLYLTDRADGEDFSDADQETIEVLADWAAIAIDNARAYGSERARRSELEQAVGGLEATIDISRALGGETEQDRVLELIVERGRALVEARSLLILLSDPGQDRLTVAALAGDADPELLGVAVPIRGSVSGTVLSTQRAQRLTNVADQLRFALAGRVHASTGMFMPLVFHGRALGVMAVFDRGGGEEFTALDERLLESFAASAAVAVATAQQVAEQGLRRSIEASERERTRWARELHDETLQELAGLRVLLASARGRDDPGTLDAAIEQIEMSITGLRRLITELRPAALDEYGVAAAIEALVDRVRATSGVDIVTDIGLAETRLEPEIESTVYRLVQEALTNAIRHGEPDELRVSVHDDEREIAIDVVDGGRGFDSAAPPTGFGLLGMRERVALVGGTLALRSAPGEGTSVTARIPSRRRPAG